MLYGGDIFHIGLNIIVGSLLSTILLLSHIFYRRFVGCFGLWNGPWDSSCIFLVSRSFVGCLKKLISFDMQFAIPSQWIYWDQLVRPFVCSTMFRLPIRSGVVQVGKLGSQKNTGLAKYAFQNTTSWGNIWVRNRNTMHSYMLICCILEAPILRDNPTWYQTLLYR
jgi:hypothetical protein